jgi:hypothetical protein
VGYWGTLVVVRSNGQMPALLSRRGAEERRHPGALRGDGWHVFDVNDNLLDDKDLLPTLASDLKSPVLAAYITDSDYGWLVGVSQAGQWQTGSDPVNAFEFERDHLIMKGMVKARASEQARQTIASFGVPPRRAAQSAVEWAAAAGYTVPARPIRQILATRRPPGLAALLRLPAKRYVFCEEMFFDLLDQLGIPRHQAS